jgi:hypothetical protein
MHPSDTHSLPSDQGISTRGASRYIETGYSPTGSEPIAPIRIVGLEIRLDLSSAAMPTAEVSMVVPIEAPRSARATAP